MSEAHAVYSPSSSHRWIECPGSIKRGGNDDSFNFFSAEGTAAHTIAAKCLSEGGDAKDHVGTHRVIGRDPTEWLDIEIGAEEASYIQVYIDAIRRAGTDKRVLIEQRIELADDFGVPGQFGTGDAVIIGDGILSVEDLKFGRGERVSAIENTQCMSYGLGALRQYEAFGPFHTVRVVIHQPRLDAISTWDTTPAELLAWRDAKVRPAIIASLQERPPIVPGTKQCRWCPAKATCLELREHVATAAFDNLDTQPTVKDVSAYDDASLAAAMDMVELVEAWAAAVYKESETRTLAGRPTPGWKVVKGKKGARTWKDADAAAEALKKLRLKVDQMYDRSLKSPTQIEKSKVIGAEKWAEISKAHVHQADGKPQVVRESDPRESISPVTMFEAVNDASDLL